MNEECINFENDFNITSYLDEEEESILIDSLRELIIAVKKKRHKGGYIIHNMFIKDDNNQTVGIRKELTIRLLEKK